MPELPDVETVRRAVLPHVAGKEVVGPPVLHNAPRLVQTVSPEEFARTLHGLTILDVWRRAKYLLFPLAAEGRQAPQRYLVVHLRMTGHMDVLPTGSPIRRFDRLVIPLDSGIDLRFSDARKLGKVWLVDDPQEATGPLGPEPLGDSFTVEVLADILRDRRAAVKSLLLDQTAVAGIGNIYADEALWEARIRPARQAAGLSAAEVTALHAAIRNVLGTAVEKLTSLLGTHTAGFNPERYVFPWESDENASVEALSLLKVPRAEGKPCPRCKAPVQRAKVQSRSSYFCPVCQV
jgi:formamidopyrimidine-DNA glycosylase